MPNCNGGINIISPPNAAGPATKNTAESFRSSSGSYASPKWKFDDATFDRSAASLENPDHVAIVIHNYRWRLGLAEGEPRYDDLERRLAEAPVIAVPTITLEGDANGAPHPDASAYAKKFSGKYSHRVITGGIGHNLPQEAPQAFAAAVIDVDAR
jgi:pimeloyl-ACP methyl ester carboxylesterase